MGFRGRKGFFLTFMVFLLISAVLALQVVIRQGASGREQELVEENALREVNETFNSLYSQLMEDREGYAGEVQQRVRTLGNVPGGGTSFTISQQVPPPDADVTAADAYDALNALAIFISDSNITPGVRVRAEVPDAFNITAWGGQSDNPDTGYIIQPYCIRYLPLESGDRLMAFEIPSDWEETLARGQGCVEGTDICYDWGCEQPFDMENIESIDIDFTVGAPYDGCTDYLVNNALSCSGSFSGCPAACTIPDDEVCVTVNLFEEECQGSPPECEVDGETVAENLDITTNNNKVTLGMGGGTSIVLNLLSGNTSESEYYLFSYNGQNICLQNTADVTLTFVGDVYIKIADFEFGIRKEGFGYCRATSEGMCR